MKQSQFVKCLKPILGYWRGVPKSSLFVSLGDVPHMTELIDRFKPLCEKQMNRNK
jgi:hypothetical protein